MMDWQEEVELRVDAAEECLIDQVNQIKEVCKVTQQSLEEKIEGERNELKTFLQDEMQKRDSAFEEKHANLLEEMEIVKSEMTTLLRDELSKRDSAISKTQNSMVSKIDRVKEDLKTLLQNELQKQDNSIEKMTNDVGEKFAQALQSHKEELKQVLSNIKSDSESELKNVIDAIDEKFVSIRETFSRNQRENLHAAIKNVTDTFEKKINTRFQILRCELEESIASNPEEQQMSVERSKPESSEVVHKAETGKHDTHQMREEEVIDCEDSVGEEQIDDASQDSEVSVNTKKKVISPIPSGSSTPKTQIDNSDLLKFTPHKLDSRERLTNQQMGLVLFHLRKNCEYFS